MDSVLTYSWSTTSHKRQTVMQVTWYCKTEIRNNWFILPFLLGRWKVLQHGFDCRLIDTEWAWSDEQQQQEQSPEHTCSTGTPQYWATRNTQIWLLHLLHECYLSQHLRFIQFKSFIFVTLHEVPSRKYVPTHEKWSVLKIQKEKHDSLHINLRKNNWQQDKEEQRINLEREAIQKKITLHTHQSLKKSK